MQPEQTIEQNQSNQQPQSNPITAQITAEPETEDQINWKRFREDREKDRRQREEDAKRIAQKEEEAKALKAALEAVVNKPNNFQNEPGFNEDDTQEQIIQKKVDEALQKRLQQQAQIESDNAKRNLPNTLKSAYSDFNQVVTQENMDYLEYHYPEVAVPYTHMPEGFDKWAGIYKAIKRFIPNAEHKKDVKRIEQNLSKPQALPSQGTNNQMTGQAPSILTEEKRKQNWERMQRTLKGLS